MTFHIRPATPQDYKALCSILEGVDAMHRDRLPHIFQKPAGPARELDYILGLIADESHALLVAELEGRIVGTVHVAIGNAAPIPLLVPRRFAVVNSLMVEPEFRRMGIGQALMHYAERWAAARGATTVELTVYEFNQEAMAFYRQLRYEILSRRMSRDPRSEALQSASLP
jgi:ribosomal protein S18 acetylase RimI-like enzyme